MNFSHLTNKLKSLSHYESEIDTTDVWSQLESKIYAEDRSKRLFYFCSFGVVISLIIFVGVSFSFFGKNNSNTTLNNKISGKLVTDISKSGGSVETQSSIEKRNDSNYENNSNQQIALTRSKTKTIAKSELEKLNHEKDLEQKHNLNYKSERLDEAKSDQTTTEKRPILEKIDIEVITKNATESNLEISSSILKNMLLAETKNLSFESRNISSQRSLSPVISISALPYTETSAIEPTQFRSLPTPDECPTLNKKTRKIIFSIRPYSAYDHPMTQLYIREGNSNVEAYRASVESNYLAYSYGLELRAKTRSGINLLVGINQSIKRDKFDYSLEKDSMILLENVIKDISINANQDSIVTYGDTLVSARVIETGRKFNTYKSIDIPIGVEFSTRLSNLEFGISSSAIFNLAFRTKGSVSDENDAYTSIDGKYMSSIGVRFRLSTPIQYYIGEHMSLGLAPSFTFSPNSISSSSIPIEHKVNLLSMRLFADYSF